MGRESGHVARPMRESLTEYSRGFAGGLLFSLPLLYTMEVWWSGFIAGPERLLGCLAFTLLLLVGYNYFSGFRQDGGWIGTLMDSLEELGLGLLFSALALFLTGRIGPGVAIQEMVGKVVVEAAVVAIGVSVGRAQLGEGGQGDEGASGGDGSQERGLVRQVAITFCGAVLFAANVAPTEEIVMIAVESSSTRLLGIAVLSIVIGALILYESNFMRSSSIIRQDGPLDIVMGSVMTYAVAVGASALILWFFGRFDGCSLYVIVGETVVLAFPAAVGGAAGRLILQGSES